MQISDLLGKYGQNIQTYAQEQTAKMGTQQLSGSLAELKPGHIFEGTIREMTGSQVLLMLGNGDSIAARIEGQMNLMLNQSMFFEVKSNTPEQIAIKPYLGGNGSNPTLMKALMQAGLGVTESHLEMVKSMMEEQMPIDKQSLNQMARQLAAFPKAEPGILAQMNKLGIPVTEENIQQFINYKADAAAISKELDGVVDQIPRSIVPEGSSSGEILAKNAQMMEIFFGGGESADGSVRLIGQGQPLEAEAEKGIEAETGKETAQTAGKEAVQEAVQETLDPQKAVPKEGQTSETGKAQAPAAEVSQTENLAKTFGKETIAGLEKQLADLGIEKGGKLLDENGKLNTRMTSGEFLEKLQEELKNGELPDRNTLEKFFTGREYKALLKDAVGRQWSLEPQEVESKEKVSKLYDKLQDQMNRLEEFAKQSGMENAGLKRAVTTVRANINFMNEVNQIYNFVQIPLKMNGQNVNSELYVYTNKKNLADPDGELSAFLHLDMDHLGSTDVSVKMKGTAVKTNFYLEDDKAFSLILEHAQELAERLEKKGYHCEIQVENEEKNMDFVDDFLKRDAPGTGRLYRYSFDVRA